MVLIPVVPIVQRSKKAGPRRQVQESTDFLRSVSAGTTRTWPSEGRGECTSALPTAPAASVDRKPWRAFSARLGMTHAWPFGRVPMAVLAAVSVLISDCSADQVLNSTGAARLNAYVTGAAGGWQSR